jgi:membrane-associated phospholipid phosphatase
MESLDVSLLLWVNSFSGEHLLFDNIIKQSAGDYLFPVYASLILMWMWFSQKIPHQRSRYQVAVLTAIASIGLTNFAVRVIMELFPRSRPFEDLAIEILLYAPTDPSFPSNPVSVLATITFTIFIVSKRIGVGLFFMTAALGFGRIYGGVAYPSDVLGGIIVGVACGLLILVIARMAYPTLQLFLRLARIICLA